MEKVLVGKYVKTHGIKGEIKIKSNFEFKDRVFMEGNKIFLEDKEFVINSYRKHQDFDMVTLKGISDINEILPFKGSKVFVLKSDINLLEDEYLDKDLISFDVYQGNELKGVVQNIIYLEKNKKLLVVNNKYVPFELIKKVNLKEKKIEVEEVLGLL